MDVNQTYGDPFRMYTYIKQLYWIPESNITPIIPQ